MSDHVCRISVIWTEAHGVTATPRVILAYELIAHCVETQHGSCIIAPYRLEVVSVLAHSSPKSV